MKKIFLFLFAAFFAANMQAELNSRSYQQVDSLPYPRYIRNIRVDKDAKTVTFDVSNPVFFEDGDPYTTGDDTFLPHEAALNHQFTVIIFNRAPYDHSHTWKITGNGWPEGTYNYGELVKNDEGKLTLRYASYFSESEVVENTADKLAVVYTQTMDISAPLDTMLARGYTDLHVAIIGEIAAGPFYSIWAPFETRSTDDNGRRLYLNNYVDISYPTVTEHDLSASAAEVKYGENFSLTGTIKGTNKTKITLQYQQEDQTWKGVEAREISAAQAQEGYTYTYKRVMLNDYPAARTYRLKIQDILTGNIYYSNTVNVTFKYRLNKVDISSTYYSAGHHIILGNPAEGKQFTFSSDYPVLTDTTENGIEFDMPACNVLYRETAPMYTVKFYDYDHTLLSTQQVEQGHSAYAPVVPAHEGMTFHRWNGDYSDIRNNCSFTALYKIEGVEAELSRVDYGENYIMMGERYSFNAYLKAPNTAKVYLQVAYQTHDDDELAWGNSTYNYVYTVAEAENGTTKTFSDVLIKDGANKYRAVYFRLKIQMHESSEFIYSNVIGFKTFYPVNIYSQDLSLWTQTNDFSLLGNGTILARPLDTIWIQEVASNVCALDLDLWMGEETTGEDQLGTYIVMPEGYGDNTITVRRHKHTVLFYAEGHMDGYWRLIHGDGVYEPQEIFCGGAATPPEIEEELTKSALFHGWKARGEYADDAYLNVTEDMAFDAILQPLGTFIVTFKDWDGSTLDIQTVVEGENACPPDAYRPGYEFIGWDGSYTQITSNCTLNAIYEEIPEAIDNIDASDTFGGSRKFLRDGQLLILRPDGKTYNAQGAQVQ